MLPEIVQKRQKNRDEIAKKILEFKKELHYIKSIKERNDFINCFYKYRTVVLKPTVENLWKEACALLRQSQRPIVDYSTEYYSTCGLDDAQLETKRKEELLAIELFSAWKQMNTEYQELEELLQRKRRDVIESIPWSLQQGKRCGRFWTLTTTSDDVESIIRDVENDKLSGENWEITLKI